MARIANMLVLEDRMTRTLHTIDQAAQASITTFQALQQQVNSLSTQMSRMQSSNLNGLNTSLNTANNTMESIVTKARNLALIFGGIEGIKQLVALSDERSGIKARLSLLVSDGGSLQALEKEVFDSANRVGVAYGQVADIVGRIGNQAGDAFGSNSEVVAFAELLNKTFSNAGADATAIASTMYNLTQSLSSGHLLGNDFRIIKQNAPQMIKYLERFYGVNSDELGKMVTAGKVSAQDIKNAMFAAGDEIDEIFNGMPVSWENNMERIKNHAIQAFDPILQKINEIANSQGFTDLATNIISGLYMVANVANSVFTGIVNITKFIANNWSIIAPIIGGIIAQMLLYKGALLAVKAVEVARNVITGIGTALSKIQARATRYQTMLNMGLAQSYIAATGAQLGLNVAMLANPVFLIIAGIVALIAIIFVVINVINKVTGQSINAIGVIVGALAVAGAFILNRIMGLLDVVLGIINYIGNGFIAFGNFLANVFKDPIASIIHLFGDMGDRVLGIINSIAKAIDKVFGSNLSGAVEGWRSNLNKWIEDKANKYGNGTYQKVVENLNLSSESLGLKRIDYGQAYNAGYGVGEKISNMFGNLDVANLTGMGEKTDYSKYINDSLNNALGTDDKGGKAVKTTTDDKLLSDEDIQLLLDVATRDYKLNYQQITPQVSMTFGDIRETADVDIIADQLADKLQEIAAGNLEVTYT